MVFENSDRANWPAALVAGKFTNWASLKVWLLAGDSGTKVILPFSSMSVMRPWGT